MTNELSCSGRFRDLTALGEKPAAWNHMVPKGEFPGTVKIPAGYDVPGYGIAESAMEVEGLTVLGDRELESIVQRFSGDMLIDPDHLSHDKEHSTEAMGWGQQIRYMHNRADGLEVSTEWTPLGKDKILHKIYRYISPEFAGSVRYEDGTFKFFPVALTGAGLTNRPKLRALKPVSANRETQTTTTMSKALTLLCGLLSIPETTPEAELESKVSAFQGDHASSKNRAAEADKMETEIKVLRDEAIDRDLEKFSDVIEDKDSAKVLLQTNREATVKFFTAAQAKQGEKSPAPLHQRNRATAPDGSKFSGTEDDKKDEERVKLVATVKNRDRCNFETAWATAKLEKPELF
jgi:phage I-like protein